MVRQLSALGLNGMVADNRELGSPLLCLANPTPGQHDWAKAEFGVKMPCLLANQRAEEYEVAALRHQLTREMRDQG